MPPARTPVIDRLMRRIMPIPESGCWIWEGYLNPEGYGKIGVEEPVRSVDRTHRVTYRHFKGAIPEGMELDHLCRVRSCCNPEHLEAVTRKENCRRGDCGKITGAQYRAKTHCKHGHAFTPENTYSFTIKRNGAIGRQCKACRWRNLTRY